MNILCHLFGHKYDESAAIYYGMYYCDRCCQETDGRPWWIRTLWWKFKDWLRSITHRWRTWFHCRDCGWHFGRHKPGSEDDHVPF